MVKDLAMKPFQSSFLSCEKDAEIILRKLFIESRPYSDDLKRLLVINTKDCLDDKTNPIYQKKIQEMSLPQLIDQNYIRLSPKIEHGEHEEIKNYIIVTFNNFTYNATNPQFRNNTVTFDILCHLDTWNLKNYCQRPVKIVGYIDGVLNNSRLTGIGTFQFANCKEILYDGDENWAGYSLMYLVIHGSDDKIPESDKIV